MSIYSPRWAGAGKPFVSKMRHLLVNLLNYKVRFQWGAVLKRRAELSPDFIGNLEILYYIAHIDSLHAFWMPWGFLHWWGIHFFHSCEISKWHKSYLIFLKFTSLFQAVWEPWKDRNILFGQKDMSLNLYSLISYMTTGNLPRWR